MNRKVECQISFAQEIFILLPLEHFFKCCSIFSTLCFVLFLAFFPSNAESIELLVPDDYFTIMEAVEEAYEGDTVLVYPGTYHERIILKDGVNLVSYDGDDGNALVDGPGLRKVLRRTVRTIIDGSEIEEAGYLIQFPTEAVAPMRVDGFTFQNMPKYISGVNLYLMEIRGCSPLVVNNIFTGNQSWGAILATGLGVGMGPALDSVARPTIRNNVIYGNYSLGIGNGSNSEAHIIDNEIFDNEYPEGWDDDRVAPGIGVREMARPIIENNIIYANGVGVGAINFSSFEKPLIIRGNTLFNNRRAGIGLMGLGSLKTEVNAVIENNIIYGNMTSAILCKRVDRVEIRYNTMFDNRKAGAALWSVDHLIIEDNDIHGNLTAGLRITDVKSAIIQRNTIYQNVTAGIDFTSWEHE
jgi:hypothetical protein